MAEELPAWFQPALVLSTLGGAAALVFALVALWSRPSSAFFQG